MSNLTPRINRIDNYNPIINGGYDVAERNDVGATQSASAAEYLVHDRWYVNKQTGVAGGGDINITNQTVDKPTFAQSGFNFTASARLVANSIVTTGDPQFHNYGQFIEGIFAEPMYGKKCVYEFWYKSNAARNLHIGIIQNPESGTTKQIFKPFSTQDDLVWRKVQIAIDFGASGVTSFRTGNTTGIEIYFQLHNSGQATGAPIDTWRDFTAPFYATQDSFMDNASNQLWFAGHQMRVVSDKDYQTVADGGQIDMPFARTGVLKNLERLFCKRYYNQTGIPGNFKGSGKYPIGRMGAHSGAQDWWMPFVVPMRAAPSVTCDTGGLSTGLNDGGSVPENTHENGFSYRVAPNSSSWSSGLAWSADAELTS